MIWIGRLAIIFAGFVVAGVFLNLYYALCCFFTVFLLGIQNDLFHSAQYWSCLVAGVATACFLMRRTWPRASPAP